jgi:DNA-binding IclR family transcriptional regulator
MRDELHTLSKALDVLMALAQHGGDMKASELEAELEVSRSSLYRIIGTLKQKNFIEVGPQGSYRLGLTVLSLGIVAKENHSVDALVKPVMERIVQETKETVMLTSLVFPHAMCIARVESPYSIRLSYEVGRFMPLCAGASGKVLLGTLNENQLCQYMQLASERGFFAACHTDENTLRKHLDDLKQNGYSLSISEVDDDAFAVAVPVFDKAGKQRYGISLAGPVKRLQAEKFVNVLKNAAKELSEMLYPTPGGEKQDAAH